MPTNQNFTKIFALLKKEWTLEIRHRSAFYGIFLYSLLTVFLIFYSFKELEPVTWVSLFWIITLFASLNAMAKSFLQESTLRWNYYYTLFSPTHLLIAKLLYNFFLLGLITAFNLLLFVVFLNFPLQDVGMFLCSVLLGVMMLVILFSVMSAIAAKASKNASLTAIISLPIIIPMLSFLINFSLKSISNQPLNLYITDVGLLTVMNVLMLGLGLLLFRFTWAD